MPILETPKCGTTHWQHLLRQVEEVAKTFQSEREDRVKILRKISKFAQNAYNRQETIKEQKVKDDEKKVKKQAFELAKHVQR